jgi:hypothetical protein
MSARAVADSDRQMLRPPFRVLTLLLAASMAAAGLVAIAPVSAAATSAPPAGAVSSTGLCAAPLAGHRACLVRAQTIGGRRLSQRPGAALAAGPSRGYGPADIAAAYNLPVGAGSGQTVAVVDAFDNASVSSDLAAYRANWGLPACTPASGCFRKVDQQGGTTYPAPGTGGWPEEIDLDVEAVSAACPLCHILLVEANDDGDASLIAAFDEAVSLGATELSLSFGACEGPGTDQSGWDSALNRPRLPITVSSGDGGFMSSDNPNQVNLATTCPVAGAPSFPASSPFVTAVGGTSLSRDSSTARGWRETAWAYIHGSATGSGCSSNEPKPAWQHDPGCPNRMVADVSAVADPATGLAVYFQGGWQVFGGTSLSAPLVAGMDALAGGEGDGAGGQPWYAPGASLNDPASGSSAVVPSDCSSAYFCNASAGYDGPTGMGTPNGPPAPMSRPALSPSTLEFGQTGTRSLTLTNDGFESPHVDSVALSGSNATAFSVTNPANGGCLGARLPVSGSCTLAISYQGPSRGPAVLTVTLTRSDSTIAHATATVLADGVAVSTAQYRLWPPSDGLTWQPIDASALTVSTTAAQSGPMIITANADLWTETAGFNQDIGIMVNQTVVAWKESGGFAGTFSPNAAFVQTTVNAVAGETYTVTLVWKANIDARPAGAAIWAGAGPISADFSPTRLAVRQPAVGTVVATATVTDTQPTMAAGTASAWQAMDGRLRLTIPAAAAPADVILSGNADLWTETAGFNQDIGIMVNGTLVAWKESGGLAGTYSPNAAFVQTLLHAAANVSYDVALVWKANRPGGGTIVAGAGPTNGSFSPTSLTAITRPAGAAAVTASFSQQQYSRVPPRGDAWTALDSRTLTVVGSATSTCAATVSANADLWTEHRGDNQDIAVLVTPSGTGIPGVAAWRESGGRAAAYSPNAAFLETTVLLTPGTTYSIQLRWQANASDGAGAIEAAAGSQGAFSPTALMLQTDAGSCW